MVRRYETTARQRRPGGHFACGISGVILAWCLGRLERLAKHEAPTGASGASRFGVYAALICQPPNPLTRTAPGLWASVLFPRRGTPWWKEVWKRLWKIAWKSPWKTAWKNLWKSAWKMVRPRPCGCVYTAEATCGQGLGLACIRLGSGVPSWGHFPGLSVAVYTSGRLTTGDLAVGLCTSTVTVSWRECAGGVGRPR